MNCRDPWRWVFLLVFLWNLDSGFQWTETSHGLSPQLTTQIENFEDSTQEELQWCREVGERLHELLKELNWSQIRLSRETGLYPYQVNDIVKGKRTARVRNIVKIMDVLFAATQRGEKIVDARKLSADYLLSGELKDFRLPRVIRYRGGTLAQRVKYVREAFGLKQVKEAFSYFSNRFKISMHTLRDLESGYYPNTSIWRVYLVAQTYQMPADYFMDTKYAQSKDAYQRLEEFPLIPEDKSRRTLSEGLKKVINTEEIKEVLLKKLGWQASEDRLHFEQIIEGRVDPYISTIISISDALDKSLQGVLIGEEADFSLPEGVTNYPPTLGKRISYMRRLKGWDRQRLSEETGLTYNWLAKIERDSMEGVHTDPTVVMKLAKLAPLDFFYKTNKTKELIEGLKSGMPKDDEWPYTYIEATSFKERILMRLIQLDWTYLTLAKKMGRKSKQSVEHLLNHPTLASGLKSLADALGVSAQWLLTGMDPEGPLSVEFVSSYREEILHKGRRPYEWFRELRLNKEKKRPDLVSRDHIAILLFFEKGSDSRSLNLPIFANAYSQLGYGTISVDLLIQTAYGEKFLEKNELEDPISQRKILNHL